MQGKYVLLGENYTAMRFRLSEQVPPEFAGNRNIESSAKTEPVRESSKFSQLKERWRRKVGLESVQDVCRRNLPAVVLRLLRRLTH